jgi:3-dehydroquinate synthase
MSENKQHHVTIPLNLGDRSYNIEVGPGILAQAGSYLKALGFKGNVIVVTDEQVSTHHGETLKKSLEQEGFASEIIALPAGEQTKSFDVLEALLERMLSGKPDRKTPVIAFGGGVIGDLTGFAASILLRGLPFVQIPTTLLSMVDSSVGGKTAINSSHGKNLVGSFYQPRLVLADTDVLKTLPHREWLAGYAEVVKYGLINDAALFDALVKAEPLLQEIDQVSPEHQRLVVEMVTASCKAKAEIVSQDEKEAGKRALLNFGHTFGHALEAETGYSSTLLHGESVSIGSVLAFRLSEKLGMVEKGETERVITHFKAVGLKTSMRDVDGVRFEPPKLLDHMYGDKKTEGGQLVFILAKAIGEACITRDVEPAQVLQVLSEDLEGAK